MSKKLARILKTELSADLPLPAVAEMVRKKGRGRDTILAHITPREAKRLKREGGRGSINPDTGLPEFDDNFSFDVGDVGAGDVGTQAAFEQPQQAAPVSGPSATPVIPDYKVDVSAPAQDFGGFGTQSVDPFAYQPLETGYTSSLPKNPTSAFPYSAGLATEPGFQAALAGARDQYPATEQLLQETAPAPAPKPSLWERLTTPENLLKLGGVASLGGLGFLQSQKAASQAKNAKAEQEALAAPYREQSQQLISQAQAGQLTPDAQQALQAAAAQLQQSGIARGGVGAQQAATQLANLRASLLQKQYDYGLQVAGIADSITTGAIQSGLQANQAIAQAQGQFGQAMFSILGGMPGKTVA
jgi:hypothetical protein